MGSLPPELFPRVQISCFGVIPKKAPGKWRLILDLSSPEGRRLNDGVDQGLCFLRYILVEYTGRVIAAYGCGTLQAKVDIKNAYRIIPVDPAHRWLLGMK